MGSVITILIQAIVFFAAELMTALILLAYQDWFGSGDLGFFLFWSVPLFVLASMVQPFLRHLFPQILWRIAILTVFGIIIAFLYTLGLMAMFGPWWGAVSFNVFFCWLIAVPLTLLVPAEAKPLSIFFWAVLLIGWVSFFIPKESPTIIFRLPVNFKGLFMVFEDKSQGQDIKKIKKEIILNVNKDGRVPVKSLKIFESWHKLKAYFADGTEISHEIPNSEVSLFSMSRISKGNRYTDFYFIGSYEQYEKVSRVFDVSELPLAQELKVEADYLVDLKEIYFTDISFYRHSFEITFKDSGTMFALTITRGEDKEKRRNQAGENLELSNNSTIEIAEHHGSVFIASPGKLENDDPFGQVLSTFSDLESRDIASNAYFIQQSMDHKSTGGDLKLYKTYIILKDMISIDEFQVIVDHFKSNPKWSWDEDINYIVLQYLE